MPLSSTTVSVKPSRMKRVATKCAFIFLSPMFVIEDWWVSNITPVYDLRTCYTNCISPWFNFLRALKYKLTLNTFFSDCLTCIVAILTWLSLLNLDFGCAWANSLSVMPLSSTTVSVKPSRMKRVATKCAFIFLSPMFVIEDWWVSNITPVYDLRTCYTNCLSPWFNFLRAL